MIGPRKENTCRRAAAPISFVLRCSAPGLCPAASLCVSRCRSPCCHLPSAQPQTARTLVCPDPGHIFDPVPPPSVVEHPSNPAPPPVSQPQRPCGKLLSSQQNVASARTIIQTPMPPCCKRGLSSNQHVGPDRLGLGFKAAPPAPGLAVTAGALQVLPPASPRTRSQDAAPPAPPPASSSPCRVRSCPISRSLGPRTLANRTIAISCGAGTQRQRDDQNLSQSALS